MSASAELCDPELARRSVAWCEALLTRFPDDASISKHWRLALSSLLLLAGEPRKSEAVAKELCSRAPTDAAGYVALAGVYASPRAGQLHDRERAIQVLK